MPHKIRFVIFGGHVTFRQSDPRWPTAWKVLHTLAPADKATDEQIRKEQDRAERAFLRYAREHFQEDCIGLALVIRYESGLIISKLLAWSGLLPQEGVSLLHMTDDSLRREIETAEPQDD